MSPSQLHAARLRPLEGVRIVDFSSNIAGPFATMILAQLGADVIKVEPPQGDDARHWSVHEGVSLVHQYVNAGKRGVVLDLKTDEGLDRARDLAATADVVLQSMRPGVAARLGIGPDALMERNPDLLYYDLNGYGSGEEGRRLPGYDPLVQAYAGIIAMNGHDGDAPSRCAPSVVDLGTGQWIALGIMAAIMSSRQGQRVSRMETALVDTAFSLVAYQATTARITGERPPKAGSGNPIAAPYDCFQARDGELLIAAPSQRLWTKLLDVLDAKDLADDLRYTRPVDRVANRHALSSDLSRILSRHNVAHWTQKLQAHGIPVALVAGLEQAVESPIARERNTFAELDGTPLVRLPWSVDGEALPWTRRAPALGEHTSEIMTELKSRDS